MGAGDLMQLVWDRNRTVLRKAALCGVERCREKNPKGRVPVPVNKVEEVKEGKYEGTGR